MVGIIFEYNSLTHGYHKWVVIKEFSNSSYCLCAIISSSHTYNSIRIDTQKCESIRKTSFIQYDNLLSVKKDIVKNNRIELLCSSIVSELKRNYQKIIK